eukprot:8667835-Alexandrium_andersonii.AAC.1
MTPNPRDEALQGRHVEAIPGSALLKLRTPELVLRSRQGRGQNGSTVAQPYASCYLGTPLADVLF